jgi:uncharacterized protein YndB with AHSA1/START domain
MTVLDVTKDTDARTMTITARFDAPVTAVWEVWSDPRKLERWWGPPTYPATVVEHELTPGGTVTYFMTGPEGDRHHGWWRVRAVEPPGFLEFEDGFADEAGNADPAMPTTVTRVTLAEAAGGTEMQIRSAFPTTEAMERMLAMGMEAGITASVGQIDELVAAHEVG